MNKKTVNDKYVANRMLFRHYSYNASGDSIEKWDQYQLPAVEEGLSSSATYDILTSKSPVTIEQGGTGAATAAQARIKLSVAQRIQMYNANYSTWADVYAALAALDIYTIVPVYIDSNVSTLITDGKVTRAVLLGTVVNFSNAFRLSVRNYEGTALYNINITGASATGRTTTVYKFDGTAL